MQVHAVLFSALSAVLPLISLFVCQQKPSNASKLIEIYLCNREQFVFGRTWVNIIPTTAVTATTNTAAIIITYRGPVWLSGKMSGLVIRGSGLEPHWMPLIFRGSFIGQDTCAGETRKIMNDISCRRDMTEILLKAA